MRQVVVPTESVAEIKDGKKIQVEKRTMPGYVLVRMEGSSAGRYAYHPSCIPDT